MKLTNTTDFGDKFLRRMTQWIAGRLDVPTTQRGKGRDGCRLTSIHFGRYNGAWRGRAWKSGRVIVRIGTESWTATGHIFTMNGVPVDLLWCAMSADQQQRLRAGESIIGDAGELRRVKIHETNSRYPMKCKYPGIKSAPEYVLQDRMEAIVQVTAHELTHLHQWRNGAMRNREARIDTIALGILDQFRNRREMLLLQWNLTISVC